MKNLYIIPGWCDTTGRKPYRKLYEIAVKKGYNVIKKNPQWDESLCNQIFPISRDDTVFGFSLGAVFACMIAQKYPHKKVIAASMSPVLNLPKQTLNMLGKKLVMDFKKFKYGGVKAVYLYGEREVDESLVNIIKMGIKIVPKADHSLNDDYIKEIAKEL